jgi:hypothetical protein
MPPLCVLPEEDRADSQTNRHFPTPLRKNIAHINMSCSKQALLPWKAGVATAHNPRTLPASLLTEDIQLLKKVYHELSNAQVAKVAEIVLHHA